jgi:hypothetical protein
MAGPLESAHSRDQARHKQASEQAPFTYTPTQSEFQSLQNKIQTALDEQKSVFHDGLIPGIDKVMAGMRHTGDMAPRLDNNGMVMLKKTGPKEFNAGLFRPDDSTDFATIVNGKVTEERLSNQFGETTRKYGADGRLSQEEHRRFAQEGDKVPAYSDHIEYAHGQPVKTHIQDGNTTIDDNLQADGSWKKVTTINSAAGVDSETLITHKNGTLDTDQKFANGDYLKKSEDAFGALTSLDQRETDPKTGITVLRSLTKDGEIKEVPLYHI